MPRNYIRKVGSRQYRNFTDDQMEKALKGVQEEGLAIRKAAEKYGVSKDSLHRRLKGKHTGKYGRPAVFNDEDEKSIVECIKLAGEWGFPLTKLDVRLVVKGFLDRKGCTELRFQNNMPGPDWVESFLNRNKGDLTQRLCQNIKRSRANVDNDILNKYFDELQKTLKDVDPSLIVNYDETNITDDPQRKKVLVKRNCRHPERIMDSSKSSVSVMFSVAANGVLLPPYVVYKAKCPPYDTWTMGGPQGCGYNTSPSGWFNMQVFDDWFEKIIMPYFRRSPNENPKILLGDNLASHVSPFVIRQCEKMNIRFVLLPPNSTGLTQPLDVAFFKPLKLKWAEVLEGWKNKNRGTIPKDTFPRLLKSCLQELESTTQKNIQAGFRGSGVCPLDRNQVLKRLPLNTTILTTSNGEETANKGEWTASFQEFLTELRCKETQPLRVRKKRLNLPPGKGIVGGMLETDSPKNPTTQRNSKRSRKVLVKKNSREQDSEDSDRVDVLSLPETTSHSSRNSTVQKKTTGERSQAINPFSRICTSTNAFFKNRGRKHVWSSESENSSYSLHDSDSDLDVHFTSDEELLDLAQEGKQEESTPTGQHSVTMAELTKDTFVLVRLMYDVGTRKESAKHFIAQVLDKDENQTKVKVKFLRRSSKNDSVFIFPDIDDENEVDIEVIVRKVTPYKIIRGRHFFFNIS